MLLKDVVLRLEEGISMDANKIQMVYGIQKADPRHYYPWSVIPRIDWEDLSQDSVLKLRPDTGHSYLPAQYLYLFKIPEPALRTLFTLGLSQVTHAAQLPFVYKHPNHAQAIRCIETYLSLYESKKHKQSMQAQAIACNPKQLRTVSYNQIHTSDPLQVERLYVGLHVDSWDKKPLRALDQARNRICINIGKEPRYFCFINLTCTTMLNWVTHAFPEETHAALPHGCSGTDVGLFFLKKFPRYPVMRIRVDPGEAYMAPTENIMHDGSTWGMRGIDLQLTFLGYFDI